MIVRARYALTPGAAPVENAVLEIQAGRVVSLGPAGSAGAAGALDLGDVLLLPGLINAHTHLELTCLRGQVPFRGSFAEWVEMLVASLPPHQGDQRARLSVRQGVMQSLRAGVTVVGDIGYGRRQIEELASSPLRAVCFMETLGFGPKREAAVPGLLAQLAGGESSPPDLWLGVAPHAPYSTDEGVYSKVLALAGRRGWPVCTHLAETREEVEFLSVGTGPLRGLLERRGLIEESFVPPACSPVEFAERVGLLESGALLIHLNYLTDRELELVAGSPCSVVYCPRAHAFFGHEPHRFREMMAAGTNVCLGTDGLACTDSLSILDEWRFLHQRYAELDLAALLCMSTVNAARALGIEAEVGSLGAGKQADFITLPVTESSPQAAMAEILETPVEPRAVYIGGKRVPI